MLGGDNWRACCWWGWGLKIATKGFLLGFVVCVCVLFFFFTPFFFFFNKKEKKAAQSVSVAWR